MRSTKHLKSARRFAEAPGPYSEGPGIASDSPMTAESHGRRREVCSSLPDTGRDVCRSLQRYGDAACAHQDNGVTTGASLAAVVSLGVDDLQLRGLEAAGIVASRYTLVWTGSCVARSLTTNVRTYAVA